MQSRTKLLSAAAFLAFQLAFALPALAQEAQPGDACPVVGRYVFSGGPELSGVTHQMVCNAGNVWSSILDNDAAGNAALAHALSLTGDVSPAQITANQNDYNPAGLTTASVLRLNSNASRNITSLAGGADGRIVTVMNVGSFPIVLKNDDGTTGTAANRFAFTGDLTLAAKQSAMLMYDSTASRWRQIANGTATGSGDNLGNHIATANIQLGSYWLSGDGGNEGLFVENDGNGGLVSNNGNAAFIITSPLSDANTAIALRSRGSGMDREAAVWADQAGALHLKTNTFGDAILFDDGNGTSVGAFTSTRFENKVATLISGDISPAQITANQNNYNPANLAKASVLRLTSDASRTITGLAGGADGRVVTILNVGSNPIVLKNDDGSSSTAANRFALTGDLTLAAKQSAMLMYDSTASRWRQIANGTATGSGDNLGNHTATANVQLGSYWLSGDGGNEGIRVDSSGRIGIGAAPGGLASLEITPTGVFDGMLVNRIGAGTTNAGGWGIFVANAGGTDYLNFGQTSSTYTTGGPTAWAGNDKTVLYYPTELRIGTNPAAAAPVMTMTSAGNVGIGTATPADSLHVYEATPGENAGITIGNDGTGVSQQSWLNLVTKGDGSHPLGTAGVQGWQIWANADASSTLGYAGGADGLGIGYTDGSNWNDVALVIQPTDRLGIFNPFPGAGLDAGTSVALSGDISPAQITADKNNYNPTDLNKASVLRLTSDASRTITGLAGGTDGRVLTILNVGSNPIVLSNQSTSSTAGNRFAIGANITISADQSISLIYDDTSQRWRSASFPFSVTPGTGYFVLTSTTYNGNLGGLSGANSKCLTELTTNTTWKYYAAANSAGLLNSTHVKAWLCYDQDASGTCQNLTLNTQYYFAKVGNATDGGASFTTDNLYGLGPGDSANWSGATYFNGSYDYWTSRYPGEDTLYPKTSYSQNGDCVSWSSASSGQGGDTGTSNSTNTARWADTEMACNTTRRLICSVNP